jgi:hypothetical protein
VDLQQDKGNNMSFNYKIREFNAETGDIVVEYDNNTYGIVFNIMKAIVDANTTMSAESVHKLICEHYPLNFAIAKQQQAGLTQAQITTLLDKVGVVVDITPEIEQRLKIGTIDMVVI